MPGCSNTPAGSPPALTLRAAVTFSSASAAAAFRVNAAGKHGIWSNNGVYGVVKRREASGTRCWSLNLAEDTKRTVKSQRSPVTSLRQAAAAVLCSSAIAFSRVTGCFAVAHRKRANSRASLRVVYVSACEAVNFISTGRGIGK